MKKHAVLVYEGEGFSPRFRTFLQEHRYTVPLVPGLCPEARLIDYLKKHDFPQHDVSILNTYTQKPRLPKGDRPTRQSKLSGENCETKCEFYLQRNGYIPISQCIDIDCDQYGTKKVWDIVAIYDHNNSIRDTILKDCNNNWPSRISKVGKKKLANSIGRMIKNRYQIPAEQIDEWLKTRDCLLIEVKSQTEPGSTENKIVHDLATINNVNVGSFNIHDDNCPDLCRPKCYVTS